MLKYEDTSHTPSQPAANVRVTPEELAAAVTALQIRKEGQPGTIAIGDAVEELGLDVTPEEVLAEVQARRTKPKRRRDYRALACAAACVMAFGALALENNTSSFHDAVPHAAVPEASQADTLNQVGDGQQAFVDTHGLRQIIDGEQFNQVQVYPNNQGTRWGVIKHNGKVYVQVYTFSTTERMIEDKPADLYNSEDQVDNQGGKIEKFNGTNQYSHGTVKVTLPVRSFHYQDSQTANDSGKTKAVIIASGIRTDNHLWDDFADNIAK